MKFKADLIKSILEWDKQNSQSWKIVEEKITYTYLEKGGEEKEYVIEHPKHGFYKFSLYETYSHQIDDDATGNVFPLKAQKVTPKKKTITVYE